MIFRIIYLTISLLISSLFIFIGIRQYKSKTPVTINSGETPPKEEELISVEKWNKRHGRNFIIFGIILFLSMTIFVYLLENSSLSPIIQSLIFLIIIFLGIGWIIYDHNRMKRFMIKK